MRNLFTVIAISIFSSMAIALEEPEFNLLSMASSEHPCVKVNLSPEQLSAIKDIVYKNSQIRAQDEANIKKAMIEVDHVLSNSSSTKEDAEKAQNDLQLAMAGYTRTAAQLDLSINYDVLKPDQREMGSLCAKSMHGFPPIQKKTVTASLSQQ